MMAVILNSAMLDLDNLFSSLRYTQKHSHSTLTLAQINLIWLKLIHSDSTWWWQSSWILPSWIQTPTYLLLDSLKNTLPPLWLWLKLIQSDLLDDGSHLEFCHLEFCHLGISHFAQNSDSNLFNLTQTYSFSLNLLMAAIFLNSSILDSATLVFPLKLTHTCQDWFSTICTKKTSLPLPSPSFAQIKLHSFILTQLDDGSHLEFCHVGFRHLVFFSQIHSKTLSLHSDSDSN